MNQLKSLSGSTVSSVVLPSYKKDIIKKQKPKTSLLINKAVPLKKGLKEMSLAAANIQRAIMKSQTFDSGSSASLDKAGDPVPTTLENLDDTKVKTQESGSVKIKEKDDVVVLGEWSKDAKSVNKGVQVLREKKSKEKLTKKDILEINKILKSTSNKLKKMNQFLVDRFGFDGDIKDTSYTLSFLENLAKDDDSMSYLVDSYRSIVKDLEEFESLTKDVAVKAKVEADTNFSNDKDVQKAIKEIESTATGTFGTAILDKINRAYQAQKALLEKLTEQNAIANAESSSSITPTEKMQEAKVAYQDTQNNAQQLENVISSAVKEQKTLAKQDSAMNEFDLNKRLMYDASMAA